MRYLVLLLLVGISLAGCSDQVEPADDPTLYSIPVVKDIDRFNAAVPLTSAGAAEPGVVVGPDGTLYANVWTQFFKSTDGVSWSALENPLQTRGDTSLTVSPDGTLHAVAMAIASDDGPRLPYIRSTDGGATWSTPIDLASTTSNIDRPWITALPDGRLVVVWNSFEDKETPVRISSDGGLTWAIAETPAPQHYLVLGPAVPTRDGGALIPLNGFDHMTLLRLHGTTWEAIDGPVAEGGSFVTIPSVAESRDGAIWIASTVGGETALNAAWAFYNAGAGWNGVKLYPGVALMPWLQPTNDGVVATMYQRNPVVLDPILPNIVPADWDVAAVQLNASGIQRNVSVASAVHNGNICTSGAGCSQADWTFRDYFQTAVLTDGRIAVPFPVDAVGGVEVRVAISQ